ncbi:hypothetical protein JZ751_017130 [Albula glossodonta]|uniref:Protein phosphatase 1 regulatory subunit 37 n=1 Tax=Albula glossodonta TaxID=121402 RepID=A0A8T2NSL1_9TELE|nr:hypothetical protein JZ751_017130 [Albula glossodonta]
MRWLSDTLSKCELKELSQRNECLDLKVRRLRGAPCHHGYRQLSSLGEKLDYRACEALEEVFKRVQFKVVDLEQTNLDEDVSLLHIIGEDHLILLLVACRCLIVSPQQQIAQGRTQLMLFEVFELVLEVPPNRVGDWGGASALFDMIEYYESATHLNISFNKHIGTRGWQAAAHMMRKVRGGGAEGEGLRYDHPPRLPHTPHPKCQLSPGGSKTVPPVILGKSLLLHDFSVKPPQSAQASPLLSSCLPISELMHFLVFLNTDHHSVTCYITVEVRITDRISHLSTQDLIHLGGYGEERQLMKSVVTLSAPRTPTLCPTATALKMNMNLKELYLADNKLNGLQDSAQLGNLLKFNYNIQILDLRNNHIMDSGVFSLCCSCSLFVPLFLYPSIPRGGLAYVCEGLKEQRKGLVTLVLWNNQLTHNGMGYLAAALPCTQSLETLNLGHNSVGNEGVHKLKDGLIANRSVLRLGLASTKLSCEGAVAVAEFIAESPRLLRLDLRENEIKTGGLMALSLALKVNTSLLRLDLDREPKRETVRDGHVGRGLLRGVKSFIETQRALLAEIQNGCKRNFILAKEKEETEQKMRLSASMPEITAAPEEGEREEQETASSGPTGGDAEGDQPVGGGEGAEEPTQNQAGESGESPGSIVLVDSDTDEEEEDDVVEGAVTSAGAVPPAPHPSVSAPPTPPPAAPASPLGPAIVSGITVSETPVPPGTPPSPGRCISVSSPGRGHKIFMVTRVESPPEKQQLKLPEEREMEKQQETGLPSVTPQKEPGQQQQGEVTQAQSPPTQAQSPPTHSPPAPEVHQTPTKQEQKQPAPSPVRPCDEPHQEVTAVKQPLSPAVQEGAGPQQPVHEREQSHRNTQPPQVEQELFQASKQSLQVGEDPLQANTEKPQIDQTLFQTNKKVPQVEQEQSQPNTEPPQTEQDLLQLNTEKQQKGQTYNDGLQVEQEQPQINTTELKIDQTLSQAKSEELQKELSQKNTDEDTLGMELEQSQESRNDPQAEQELSQANTEVLHEQGELNEREVQTQKEQQPSSGEVEEEQLDQVDGRQQHCPPLQPEQPQLPAPTCEKQQLPPSTQEEELLPSSTQEEELLPPLTQEEELLPPSSQEEKLLPSSTQEEELLPPSSQEEKLLPSSTQEEELLPPLTQEEELLPPLTQEEELLPPLTQEEELLSPSAQEVQQFPPTSQEVQQSPLDTVPEVVAAVSSSTPLKPGTLLEGLETDCCAAVTGADSSGGENEGGAVASSLPNGLKPEFALHLPDPEGPKPGSCSTEHVSVSAELSCGQDLEELLREASVETGREAP